MAEVVHEKEANASPAKYDSEPPSPPVLAEESALVNASGHVQEVDRKYVPTYKILCAASEN